MSRNRDEDQSQSYDHRKDAEAERQAAIAHDPYLYNGDVGAPSSKRVIGLRNASTAVGVNPKDRIGASKVDLTLIPGSAQVALALALMEGATNYGAYNWRVEPVQVRTYVAAAKRHLLEFLDGIDIDRKSGVHHLGHAMACCAIIIDAMKNGTCVDDRPIEGNASEVIDEAHRYIKEDKPAGWGR